jgi:sigma-B regulation protein RsbU (phosphoserine phosphatase)
MNAMPGSLLLIDDDPDLVTTLQLRLQEEGYTVAAAQNSVAGWKEMERTNPDVILVDWEMPEMSGIELIKLIKADPVHRARYIVMITGRSGTDSIVRGLDSGADDFLNKPFEIQELLARIRSGMRICELERRIAEETKKLTVLEMALSVADKIGNPIAAARLHQQILEDHPDLAHAGEILESLRSIGSLLNEALEIINQFQVLKNPHSIPAPGGRTMIAPDE